MIVCDICGSKDNYPIIEMKIIDDPIKGYSTNFKHFKDKRKTTHACSRCANEAMNFMMYVERYGPEKVEVRGPPTHWGLEKDLSVIAKISYSDANKIIVKMLKELGVKHEGYEK